MQLGDKLGIAAIPLGIGGIGVSVAIPWRYEHPPHWLVDAFLWGGIALMVAGPMFLLIAHIPWRRLTGIKLKSPLQILFDPENENSAFWTREMVQRYSDIPSAYCDVYKVKIFNRSKSTVRNVRVSREAIGLMPQMPADMTFHKDGSLVRDLQPNAAEFVPIFWRFPPMAGDAWGPTAAAFHGPIKLTVTGDDVPPAICEFDFFPEQIPALVRR